MKNKISAKCPVCGVIYDVYRDEYHKNDPNFIHEIKEYLIGTILSQCQCNQIIHKGKRTMFRCCCGRIEDIDDEDIIINGFVHQKLGKQQNYQPFCGSMESHKIAFLEAKINELEVENKELQEAVAFHKRLADFVGPDFLKEQMSRFDGKKYIMK